MEHTTAVYTAHVDIPESWHPLMQVCIHCDEELIRIGLAPAKGELLALMDLEDMLGVEIETNEPCWMIIPTTDNPPFAALLIDDEDEPRYYDVLALYACLQALAADTPVPQVLDVLNTLTRYDWRE
jgi:hypothetical protein